MRKRKPTTHSRHRFFNSKRRTPTPYKHHSPTTLNQTKTPPHFFSTISPSHLLPLFFILHSCLFMFRHPSSHDFPDLAFFLLPPPQTSTKVNTSPPCATTK